MRNTHQPLFVVNQRADSLFSSTMSPTAHSRFKVLLPFRYSKMACALSACLLLQAYTPISAYAAASGTGAKVDQPSRATDSQLEEALIALKLKQAVEQGLIDPSVLEDYQRETLSSAGTQPSNSNTASTVSSTTKTANNNGADPNSDPIATFDRVFADNSLTTKPQAGTDLANAAIMQTPQQIEQVLAKIGSQVPSDFTQPIARLDATSPPLGFDNSLDQSAQINPSNQQTLGIVDDSEPNAATEPVYQATDVVVNPDSTKAKAAEKSAEQAVKNTSIGKVDAQIKQQSGEITDDVVDNSQQNAAEVGINPDDYLPQYEGGPTKAPVGSVVTETADEDSSKAKPGFIKGLYNRFFNDGYAGLPRISAKIYLQQPAASGKKNAPPQLVKADKDTQPAANIKAAMENITVESISDFVAVTPRLHQEAIDAAQAVGYYDIKLSFKRVASDEIAVIIEHLGEPVKVSSRIVDIRGEGSQLPEFQQIAEKTAPLEGDIFNHGVYKTAKSQIETTKEQFGFFDGQWLNKSVDVILPDNTADVDLIYDTGQRYHFDEVIFFTIDKDTGELTTDPDKLPVKPELLHQLHEFRAGDNFYAPEVTKFTNDLSATRYFNSVNVETIRPSRSTGTLGFDNSSERTAQEQDTAENNTDGLYDEQGNLLADNNSDKTAENGANDAFKPLEYSVDQETTEKLQEITAKAQRLSRLPDDRVLDETEEQAKSLLGKISNAISGTVKKIFPDEEDPLADTDSLPSDLDKTFLANRKTPQQVAETKSVPLYVFVTADKPKDVDLGIGYGTDTGVRAVARLENNLINRDGYQAGISVGASKINKSINLHASRPWKHPLNDTLSANISYEQENINQGDGNLDLETNTIKAGIARNIRRDEGWNRTYSLRYRLDELESGVTGTDRENLPVPFNREGAQFDQEALLLGYQLDKTKTDSVTNPSKGWRQYYSIEAGSDSALTDTNMAIARAGVSGVYSFGEMNKHQVVASLDGGYIWADEFENVPYKLRFFAGGDRSIRGYDYNSLSTLEKGYLVGGQVLAVGSTEYNYEFKPGLRGAVFADFGNAYDTNFETETKLGVGFGVRWASPVGMVRLDLAAGVLEDSVPIRLHFFIGSPLQ